MTLTPLTPLTTLTPKTEHSPLTILLKNLVTRHNGV